MITLRSLRPHRTNGEPRAIGEVYQTPDAQLAQRLARLGLAAIEASEGEFWHGAAGRELRCPAMRQFGLPAPARLVACVNVWNDAPALAISAPTWLPHVDAVICVDGAYASTGVSHGPSTDGSVEVLANLCLRHNVPMRSILPPGDAPWPDQRTKRGEYLRAAGEGDVLFIVDADETVRDGANLRRLPWPLDVAWVTVVNPSLYRQPQGQPRIVRWRPGLRYHGRHHWLMAGDTLVATHQYGGAGLLHRVANVTMVNNRGLGHTPERAEAKRIHMAAQFADEAPRVSGPEAAASDRTVGKRESLRIAQCGQLDAGGVMFRLHAAINATTPHASALIVPRHPWLRFPTQWHPTRDTPTAARMVREADILHCHLDYTVPAMLRAERGDKPVVIHHHGSMYRVKPGKDYFNALDPHMAGLRLVSNLELLSYADDLVWLPNPIPVAWYRRVRARAEVTPYEGQRALRVGHSPTKRHYKGTEDFLAAMAHLKAKGIAVEPVLIENQAHAEALGNKATVDVFFDSFWLGIQCSGLEAGAMGIPVIAGDATVARRYMERIGVIPYTYASDAASLTDALARFATDPAYLAAEGARIAQYVEGMHDEAVVALRYLNELDAAFGWRTRPRPLTHRPPEPVGHYPKAPDVVNGEPVVTHVPPAPDTR